MYQLSKFSLLKLLRMSRILWEYLFKSSESKKSGIFNGSKTDFSVSVCRVWKMCRLNRVQYNKCIPCREKATKVTNAWRSCFSRVCSSPIRFLIKGCMQPSFFCNLFLVTFFLQHSWFSSAANHCCRETLLQTNGTLALIATLTNRQKQIMFL